MEFSEFRSRPPPVVISTVRTHSPPRQPIRCLGAGTGAPPASAREFEMNCSLCPAARSQGVKIDPIPPSGASAAPLAQESRRACNRVFCAKLLPRS